MLKAAWHWGSDSSVINDRFGEPGHTPLYVGLMSACGSVDDDCMFSTHFMGRLLSGDSDRYKWTNHWLWRRSISLHSDPVGEHGGGRGSPLPETSSFFFFLVYISGFLFLDPEEVANLSCGTEEETAVHVLCGCEALASLRHAYLGSFFLDPEDVKNLSMGGHLELWQRDRAPLN